MNMELLYYKEDSSQNESDVIKKLSSEIKSSTCTNSQGIYRISPVVVNIGNKDFFYPKVKLTQEDVIEKKHSKCGSDGHSHEIQNRFDVKENIFGREPNPNEQSHSNFVEVCDPEFDAEKSEEVIDVEIKKPEDEEDGRKHLDKFNLLNGFRFANDPFNLKSKISFEEDYTETEVESDNIDNRIKNLFGIN
jgi:hypothetical protein